MLVAALDTATLTLSCALLEVDGAGATLLAERSEPAARKPAVGATGGHGARLPAVLTELLATHGRRLPDLGGYAVGLGPGALLTALAALPRQLEPQAFGEGWEAYEAALSAGLTKLATTVLTPPASAIGRLAAAALRTAPYDTQALSALEPHYVRASEAEVKFPGGLPPVRLSPSKP